MAWASFANLDQAIDELLADPQEVVSERESFLLRQLQVMLDQDGLLTSPEDVLIVAANRAWKKYLDLHAYICQEGRSFRNVPWMGFYADGKIQQLFPKILEVHDDVVMQRNRYCGRLGELVTALLEREPQREGQLSQVFILSPRDSQETRTLNHAIPNDKQSRSGRIVAFTMGQRYVRWESLEKAQTTRDLDSVL